MYNRFKAYHFHSVRS